MIRKKPLLKGSFERIILSSLLIFSSCHGLVWHKPAPYSSELWDRYMHPDESHPAFSMIRFFADFSLSIKKSHTESEYQSYLENALDLSTIITNEVDFALLQEKDKKTSDLLMDFLAYFHDLLPSEAAQKDIVILNLRLSRVKRSIKKMLPDNFSDDHPDYKKYEKIYGGIFHFILKSARIALQEQTYLKVASWRKELDDQRAARKKRIRKYLTIGGGITVAAIVAYYLVLRDTKPSKPKPDPNPRPDDSDDTGDSTGESDTDPYSLVGTFFDEIDASSSGSESDDGDGEQPELKTGMVSHQAKPIFDRVDELLLQERGGEEIIFEDE